MSSAVLRRVIPARAELVAHIAANLRPIDYQEALDFYDRDPAEVLMESFYLSEMCWVGLRNDVPITVFGCGVDEDITCGVPWLVGTPELERSALSFVRMSKPFLGFMVDRYRHLTNFVDSRNDLAIKWLRWLGFTVDPAQPTGPRNVLFHRVHMEA